MLENTLGGSKERVEETGVATFVFGDTFLYWGGGTLLSAVCPAAVKTPEVELEICHMPQCRPALEMHRLRLSEVLFTFISHFPVHSCERTRRHIIYVYGLTPYFSFVAVKHLRD